MIVQRTIPQLEHGQMYMFMVLPVREASILEVSPMVLQKQRNVTYFVDDSLATATLEQAVIDFRMGKNCKWNSNKGCE